LVYPGCSDLDASIRIRAYDIDHFQSDYPSCFELNGNVEISGANITNLTGLSVINSIGGTLAIYNNDSLTNLSGLESLTFVGYSLSLWENDTLSDISSLIGLTYVGGQLRISNNDLLANLYGLDNVKADSIDALYIVRNTNLSECAVQSVCDYLATPNADVTIMGNDDGCMNIYEVEQACITIHIHEGERHQEQIVFYPNPVVSNGTLKGTFAEDRNIYIHIFNNLGACLKTWHFTCQPNTQQEFSINLNDLPTGIYFVRVNTLSEIYTTKVIKK